MKKIGQIIRILTILPLVIKAVKDLFGDKPGGSEGDTPPEYEFDFRGLPHNKEYRKKVK